MKAYVTVRAYEKIRRLPEPVRQGVNALLRDLDERPEQVKSIAVDFATDIGETGLNRPHDGEYRLAGFDLADSEGKTSGGGAILYSVDKGAISVVDVFDRQVFGAGAVPSLAR